MPNAFCYMGSAALISSLQYPLPVSSRVNIIAENGVKRNVYQGTSLFYYMLPTVQYTLQVILALFTCGHSFARTLVLLADITLIANAILINTWLIRPK